MDLRGGGRGRRAIRSLAGKELSGRRRSGGAGDLGMPGRRSQEKGTEEEAAAGEKGFFRRVNVRFWEGWSERRRRVWLFFDLEEFMVFLFWKRRWGESLYYKSVRRYCCYFSGSVAD